MTTHCNILAWEILRDRAAWWVTVRVGHDLAHTQRPLILLLLLLQV